MIKNSMQQRINAADDTFMSNKMCPKVELLKRLNNTGVAKIYLLCMQLICISYQQS